MEVPREQVEAEFEAVYRDLKKVAAVPGFRAGHAPQDLLERHHGAKAREEVLERLLNRSLEEAVAAQGGLDLVGRPVVSEIRLEAHEPMTYVARLELAPEVPLGRYKGLKLERPKAKVTGEAVDQVLHQLQQAHAQLTPVLEPRATAAGDFLLVNLAEERAGQRTPERRQAVLHLDLEKDPDGILKGLLGMKPAEARTLTLKDGRRVQVELKGIKAREVAPLGDSFARTVGPYESLESLRQAVRQDLERQVSQSQREMLEAQALHQMAEEWAFEVPPSLVASQARRILKERTLDQLGKGVPPGKIEEQAQVLTDQAKLDALRQVKLFFILRRIAAAEGVAVSAEELGQRLQALAERLRMTVEELRKDLEARDLLDDLSWSMVRAKVLDRILQQAEIKEG